MPTRTKPVVRAWHGDPQLKADTVRRMQEHREADEFIQRHYMLMDVKAASGFRGCAVGCLVGSWVTREGYASWHLAVQNIFGINEQVAWIIDEIFECLPVEDCATFAVEVIEAIPVGADLRGLADPFLDSVDLINDDPTGSANEFIDALKNASVPM